MVLDIEHVAIVHGQDEVLEHFSNERGGGSRGAGTGCFAIEKVEAVVEAALVVAVDCIDCIRGRSDGRVIGGEGGKGRVLQ